MLLTFLVFGTEKSPGNPENPVNPGSSGKSYNGNSLPQLSKSYNIFHGCMHFPSFWNYMPLTTHPRNLEEKKKEKKKQKKKNELSKTSKFDVGSKAEEEVRFMWPLDIRMVDGLN